MALSYEELRKCWVKGFRNGNVRKLSRLQRALYRACLVYARKVGRIVNEFLVGRLKPIMETLSTTFRARALRAGLERLRAMLSSSVSKWAPQVRVWACEESYILWLGLLKINSPKVFM
ncbi:hypothetical protein DRO58_05170 [Candidatus Bathyarchaeota archaeon]|nr:MAG: hypothetical protein DRO58_05170 [Candidatus Bathyarchaeota archaeon]